MLPLPDTISILPAIPDQWQTEGEVTNYIELKTAHVQKTIVLFFNGTLRFQ